MHNFLPKHIAIIMDGNGRWAKKRMLPRVAGHHEGVKAVRKVVQYCMEKNIEVLTLFAFSSENWQRPKYEVKTLMALLMRLLDEEIKKIHENNISLTIIGDLNSLSAKMRSAIIKAQNLTKDNTGLKLNIAINYGGKWDIVQAVKKMLLAVKDENLDINENTISNYLSLANMPAPDLLIRTSGEQRLSNFLLWQLAYTELYFTNIFWPDFNESDMDQALAWFASRERRFGVIMKEEPLSLEANA